MKLADLYFLNLQIVARMGQLVLIDNAGSDADRCDLISALKVLLDAASQK